MTVLVGVLLVRSVARLSRVVVAHRRGALAALLVGALAWGALAVSGVQVAGQAVASTPTAGLAREHVAGGWADYRDESAFGTAIADDELAGQPDLLGGLAGKDVLVVFVESYGAAALTDPDIAKGVTPVLDAGEESLGQVGVEARSGWLTSPTVGAGSWLAHATLQSGLWVDDDRRYEQLLAADRLTLTRAFSDAGWRTSFVLPAVAEPWPQGTEFYGFDRLHAGDDLGYRGPELGWGGIPDQYTLAWVWRSLLAGTDGPVMAEIDLVSSHNPWPQPPPLLPWGDVGDGSTYTCMPGCAAQGPQDVRSRYAASVGYSLESVVSLVEEHPDLVVLVLGDHQPWGQVTGDDPRHDVPVTLLAGDAEVIERVDGWGWTPGMQPAPDSPVWRMDAFRDRFLGAFSRGVHER
ncbi:CDP-alcohol phosphatidyltransferase [Janibacter alittae]|uniref:CDP-alcohol phosphatidyltransferase n=1 Tax=Janibacter alittae TaxID=3115209 RepID=A0ABZ2MKV4_9MICO